jgi:hypothetical protein
MSSRLIRSAAAAVVAMMLGQSPAFALTQNTPPAGAPTTTPVLAPLPTTGPGAAAEALPVLVVEIVGKVSVSTDEGKTWQPATANMKVSQGAQFRTGMRSSVTCVIPPDQTFKLESLSTIRVSEAIKRGTKASTELLMKYGAASYGIQQAGLEHASTIRTPSSTLAVRGTVVRVVDQAPFPPTAESFTGRAVYQAAQRQTRLGGTGYAIVNSVQGSAAQTALANSVVDPSTASARTTSEARYVADQVSRGAVLSFDQQAGIPVIRGGSGPVADDQLAGSLPGRLNFALRWSGNADLNFLVDDQPITQANIASGTKMGPTLTPPAQPNLPAENLGQIGIIRSPQGFQPQEILFPGFGLNVNSSGGQIPYDHRGGKNGGQEIAYWPGSFPSGVYGVGVLHVSGQSADFKINAFADGKPLQIYGFDAEGNLARFTTLKGTVGPGETDAGIVFVPGNPYYESTTPSADSATQAIVTRALTQLDQELRQQAGGSTSTQVVTGPTAKPAAPTATAANLRHNGRAPFDRKATASRGR